MRIPSRAAWARREPCTVGALQRSLERGRARAWWGRFKKEAPPAPPPPPPRGAEEGGREKRAGEEWRGRAATQGLIFSPADIFVRRRRRPARAAGEPSPVPGARRAAPPGPPRPPRPRASSLRPRGRSLTPGGPARPAREPGHPPRPVGRARLTPGPRPGPRGSRRCRRDRERAGRHGPAGRPAPPPPGRAAQRAWARVAFKGGSRGFKVSPSAALRAPAAAATCASRGVRRPCAHVAAFPLFFIS